MQMFNKFSAHMEMEKVGKSKNLRRGLRIKRENKIEKIASKFPVQRYFDLKSIFGGRCVFGNQIIF